MAEYYRNAWYAQLQKKVAELEEEISRAVQLPTVTAEDDGKVLVADEGHWVAGHPLTYSTDEQVVGTWIDSKPVYQKTIVYSDISGETYTSPALGLNIKNVVDFFTTIKLDERGGYQWITAPYMEDINFRSDSHYEGADDCIKIKALGWYLTDAIVTLRYTKTTD